MRITAPFLIFVVAAALSQALAQQQTGNEVSRRIGVLAAHIKSEAIKLSTLSKSIEGSGSAEFRRTLESKSWGDTVLSQKAIQDIEKGFTGIPSKRNVPELAIGKRLAAANLEGTSVKVKEYAAYLKSLQEQLASLPAQEALDRLHSIYLPPEVMIVLQDKSGGDSKPQTVWPFVIVPDGSGFTTDYPAVAAILNLDDDDVLKVGCTGTLVSPNIVLTAAHCTVLLKNIKAVFFPHAGVFSLGQPPIVHEHFKADLSRLPEADIAILVLSQPVTGIRPASINDAADISAGDEGQIVGYGARRYYASSGGPLSEDQVLAATGLKIRARVKTSSCVGDFLETAICWRFVDAGANFGTTCKGNSGGPLFVTSAQESILYGVTSAGDGNKPCALGSHAFDVDVFKYAAWIKEKINSLPSNSSDQQIERLSPGVNGTGQFILSTEPSKEHFVAGRLVWEKSVQVPENLALLRLAVNTTLKGVKITMLAQPEAGPPQAVKCEPSYLGNIVFCEVNAPLAGVWRIRLQGDADKEFQMVVTGFKRRTN